MSPLFKVAVGSPDAYVIKTRNRLIHTAEDIDEDILFNDMQRLKAIIERLLLRILGWNDLSRAPNKYQLEYLRKNNDV